MIDNRKIYGIEFAAILLLWTLVVVSPLLFMKNMSQEWHAVHVMWAECAVVGVVFLVNRFLLMPRLFFAKRYVSYVCSVVVLLALLSIFILCFDGVNIITSLFGVEDLLSAPPIMPQPIGGGGASPWGAPPMVNPPVISVIPPAVSVMVASALVIALDLGLRIAVTWLIAEQKQATINRERVTAQLQNLQSQVSPHFFMNTLNNIHALVDLDSTRAKQTIIELSNLMSYLLYDCSDREDVLLQRELDFISSYVSLMRLRFSTQVKISFSHDRDVPMVKIPPLLFLNFIENTFKYGVDYDQESIIRIKFRFTTSDIEMTTLNTNHSPISSADRHGLGISNARKRLDLIYGDSYTLDIDDMEKFYNVTLKIPIQ